MAKEEIVILDGLNLSTAKHFFDHLPPRPLVFNFVHVAQDDALWTEVLHFACFGNGFDLDTTTHHDHRAFRVFLGLHK